jgi:hypothetical protein
MVEKTAFDPGKSIDEIPGTSIPVSAAAPAVVTSESTTVVKSKSMKTPQGLNNAMFSLNMATMFLGIRDNGSLVFNTTLFFSIFFVLLRIKIYLDDSCFLEDGVQDERPQKKSGYLISIFSWILFSFSAYHLNDNTTNLKLWFFIAAISLSTIWVIVIMFKFGWSDKKHNTWLLTNLFYLSGAFGMIYLKPGLHFILICILCLTLVIDTIISNPLEIFDRK